MRPRKVDAVKKLQCRALRQRMSINGLAGRTTTVMPSAWTNWTLRLKDSARLLIVSAGLAHDKKTVKSHEFRTI